MANINDGEAMSSSSSTTTLPRLKTTAELVRADTPEAFPHLDLLNISDFDLQRIRVSKKSIFSDDIWEFDYELSKHEVKKTRILFDLRLSDGSTLSSPINRPYLCSYKEFAYSMISDPPASMPKLSTLFHYLGCGPKSLILYMQKHQIQRFSDLTAVDFRQFLAELSTRANSNSQARGVSRTTLESRAKGLSWMFQQRTKIRYGVMVDPWAEQTMVQWAKQQSQVKHLVEHTREMSDEVARSLIQAAVKTLSTLNAYLTVEVEYKQSSQHYKNNFKWRSWGFDSLQHWSQRHKQITAAAYILIAMFSGMRVNEVLAIRLSYEQGDRDGAIPWKSIEDVESDGELRKCYFVFSKTKKLLPEPVIVKWQVCPIVHDAIEAITRLSADVRGPEKYLFASGKKIVSGKVISRISQSTVQAALRAFIKENAIAVDEVLWPIKTHQFRKKFARMLFKQGLGIRSIQDQLKHFDIGMTKLYADPALNNELHAEKFEVSREIYAELLLSSKPIIGGGASEFIEMRSEFIGKTRIERAKMLDALPGNALIDAVDFGFCLYNARRAQCGGNKIDCKPAECLNSVIPLESAIRMLRGRKSDKSRQVIAYKSAHFEPTTYD
jgi:hypothetical protein